MRALFREDGLNLQLAARINPASVGHVTHSVLAALADAGPFRPMTVGDSDFNGRFEVDKLANELTRALDTPNGRLVGAGAALWPNDREFEYNVRVRPHTFAVRANFLLSEFQVEDACEALIALIAKLGSCICALFGRAHSSTDLQLAEPPLQQREYRIAPDQVDEVYWLNVWGTAIVERIGRERVLATPAWRVKELPYGGVLVVIRPAPCDYASPETRDAQAHVLAHVRPDLDETAIRGALAERSRKLTLVEYAFDSDVAELLELLVEREMRSDRPTTAAQFNAYHPPAVTELRKEPLPPQGTAAAAVERYGDDAERLVAMLRKDVPEIENSDPAVMPQIDYHLWRFAQDYVRADIERDLVPAVGAYLGQMMVDRLGGSWVPRTKLDEAQVVIGGTAYLPFLRARHALSSRQAQLDHSLTQFFRVAARETTSRA